MKTSFISVLFVLGPLAGPAAAESVSWATICKLATMRETLRSEMQGRNLEIFDADVASLCPRMGLPDKPVHDSADPSREKSHTDWIYDAHYSADGKTILSASRDGSLGLWDVDSGKLLRRIVMPEGKGAQASYSYVRSAVFIGDGKTIAAGKDTLPVQLYTAATGDLLGAVPFSVAADSFFPPRMATTSTGLLFLAGDSDTVDAIDVATKAVRYKLAGHGKQATSVAVSEAADLVATTSPGEDARGDTKAREHKVFLWRLATGEKLAEFTPDGTSSPDRLNFSRDGSMLAVIVGGSVHVYSVKDKRVTRTIVVHPMFSVFDAAFTADGKGLLTCQSHPVLWDLESGKQIRPYGPFNDLCHSIEVSPDGKYAVTTSMASDLKIWEIATGTFERRLGIDVKPPR